jgi:hypothetical protein
MNPFRIYPPEACGADGYPLLWHKNIAGELDDLIGALELEGVELHRENPGIKHIVRAQARHRCIRCRHPYIVGVSGEFDGPRARQKGLAAELGVNQEELDFALEDVGAGISTLNNAELNAAPRKNWSDCDDLCSHGGPIRVLDPLDSDGWEEAERIKDTRGAPASLFVNCGNPTQALWRILTVHHLNEWKPDLRWWNLVALCQRCHLLIQGKVVMDRPWPWEHTDWFKPYVAAFYAMKYLHEDLDRQSAEARMDELLQIGSEEESVERMPL